MKAAFYAIRNRLNERSTYLFITAGMGSVTILPHPFNWIGFALLGIAAFVPDGPMAPPPSECNHD